MLFTPYGLVIQFALVVILYSLAKEIELLQATIREIEQNKNALKSSILFSFSNVLGMLFVCSLTLTWKGPGKGPHMSYPKIDNVKMKLGYFLPS